MMEPRLLLEHADFVRSLAQSLVLDEHRARDISQQTWLAALENPPDPGRPVRHWLSRVVRNFARRAYRTDTRRARREQAAAQPETLPSAERIAEREEARRKMIDAVLQLSEPIRMAILLRYYEDLPPQAIARRLDLPLGTVKTRLKRGLQQLRERLDHSHGGDRKTWCLALAPFFRLETAASAASAAGAAGAVPSLIKGGLVVSSKLKAGALAALLLGTVITIWQVLPDQVDTGPASGQVARSDGASDAGAFPAPAGARVGSDDAMQGFEPAAHNDGRRIPVAAERIPFSGRVTDKLTGHPVKAAFFFMVGAGGENNPSGIAVNETVHHEEGCFSFSLYRGGVYELTVVTSQHLRKIIAELEIHEEKGLTDFKIEMNPGLSVSGRVREMAGGRPVEGAIVGVVPHSTGGAASPRTELRLLLDGRDAACLHTCTDEKGHFTLSGLNALKQKIVAVHSDFCEGWVEYTPGEDSNVLIQLIPGARIFGTAFDDQGNRCEGVTIYTSGREMPLDRYVKTGPDGNFRTAPLKPGRVWLSAEAPRRERSKEVHFTFECRAIDMEGRDVEVLLGPSSPEYLTWQGTLYDLEGNPAAQGSISLSQDRTSSLASRFSVGSRRYTCDDQGRFEIHKLVPGRYKVQLIFTPPSLGMHYFDYGTVTFDRAGDVEQDIRISGGGIRGTVTGSPAGIGGRVRARLISSSSSNVYGTIFGKDGGFQFSGLPPGTYEITARYSSALNSPAETVQIIGKEMVSHVRLLMPPAGSLEVEFTGFAGMDTEDAQIRFTCAEESNHASRFHLSIPDSGKMVRTFRLEQGQWKATLSFKGQGMMDRGFTIDAGCETQLVIHGEEFKGVAKPVTISGTLTLFDGSPLAGVEVNFSPYHVPGRDKRASGLHQADTNEDGRFTVMGLMPGTWRAFMFLPDYVTTYLDMVNIPADAPDPFTVQLVLPSGKLTGAFRDKQTGLPIDGESVFWTVDATNPETGRQVGSQYGHGLGKFSLGGLPAIQYRLDVDVQGYEKFTSDLFRLLEGQTLHWGDVNLDPCGVLDLHVVDGQGEPIPHITVFCNDTKCHFSAIRRHGDGHRVDKLPFGTVNILIRKHGYEDREFTTRLDPGLPGKERVVIMKK